MSRQTKVIEWCKSKYDDDSKEWTEKARKWSEDKKFFFPSGTYKCNLFVYDALVSNGVSVPTFIKKGEEWPPNTKDWYDEEVDGFSLVGKGKDGLNKSWPGDICVIYLKQLFVIPIEHHIGFIYGPQKTISAAPNGIVINDWGWREYDYYYEQYVDHKNGVNKNVRIYRYHP